MQLTSQDLFGLGVIERIIREPKTVDSIMFDSLKNLIAQTFDKLGALDTDALVLKRYNRFRKY